MEHVSSGILRRKASNASGVVIEGEFRKCEPEPTGSLTSVGHWSEGLPRSINPITKKDDSAILIKHCEEAHKMWPNSLVDQINGLRRKLYLSIVYLRKTHIGWVLDGVVEKTGYTPILH